MPLLQESQQNEQASPEVFRAGLLPRTEVLSENAGGDVADGRRRSACHSPCCDSDVPRGGARSDAPSDRSRRRVPTTTRIDGGTASGDTSDETHLCALASVASPGDARRHSNGHSADRSRDAQPDAR